MKRNISSRGRLYPLIEALGVVGMTAAASALLGILYVKGIIKTQAPLPGLAAAAGSLLGVLLFGRGNRGLLNGLAAGAISLLLLFGIHAAAMRNGTALGAEQACIPILCALAGAWKGMRKGRKLR